MASIIAEIGSVHDGSFGNALKLIEAASACGADVIKFQTHIAEAETIADAPSPSYFKGESRIDYFRRTSFTIEQWKKISDHCIKFNVEFLSSPFSLEAVDLLVDVGIKSFKIPSGEVNNTPLLEKVQKTGKKVYISSGMSNWSELDNAMSILNRSVCDIVLMQCSSIYPCPPEKVGLNVMLDMQKRYGIPIGYSDHTLGHVACISAVALGATVIEKHFTFSKLMYGSDAQHSMEPNEFKKLCVAVKEAAIIRNNDVDKDDLNEYKNMKLIFEKSIVAAKLIKSGEILTIDHLAFKKPGDGIPSSLYKQVLGKKVITELRPDQRIKREDLM